MKKIIHENPIFVLLLGLCSALAVTTKVENAILMGCCFIIVMFLSSTIISIFKRWIPNNVQIPVYILIIATIVTILEILLSYFAPAIDKVLGIYLPLIVVNCIVLGKCMSVASKSSVIDSMKDALLTGFGYLFALLMIAVIRETLGSGTITLMDASSVITHKKLIIVLYKNLNLLPLSILLEPSGAFLVIAFLIALFQKKGEKHESI
ncbi:MAG: electron transport complex subunit RsxE [Tenericutes bacterium]|nr:electron transport complex subunit RsxE [Mycoplasmatota bacterium]